LVSREFYPQAAPVLYSTVNLIPSGWQHRRTQHASARIELFHRTLSSNSRLASFVESLVLPTVLEDHGLKRICPRWITLCQNLRELIINITVDGPALSTLLLNNPNLRFLSVNTVDTSASIPEPQHSLTALESLRFESYHFDRRPWNTITCLSINSTIFDIPTLPPQLISFKFQTGLTHSDLTLPFIFRLLHGICTKTPGLRFMHLSMRDACDFSSDSMVRHRPRALDMDLSAYFVSRTGFLPTIVGVTGIPFEISCGKDVTREKKTNRIAYFIVCWTRSQSSHILSLETCLDPTLDCFPSGTAMVR
jgi:hypothetical protein